MATGRHHLFKPLIIYTAILTVLVVVTIIVAPSPRVGRLGLQSASAVGGYSASDGLGQLNGANTPYFDSSNQNNEINAWGYSTASGIAIDETNHRLFVYDNSYNRVVVYDLDTSNDLVDHVADYVLGQSNFKTVDAGTTQSTLRYANSGAVGGVAYDPVNNRLFVADQGNYRVLVFDVAEITNGENAINVIGQTDFVSSVQSGTQGGLIHPNGLAYDSVNSRLFVADATLSGFSRVLVYDADPAVLIPNDSDTDGPLAINVLGSLGYEASGCSILDEFNACDPRGIAYDASPGAERLFVADAIYARVMVWDLSGGITNSMAAAHVLGKSDFDGTDPLSCGSGAPDVSCFGGPNGLAYDPVGDRLFVTDGTYYRVLVFHVDAITDGEDAVNVLGHDTFTAGGPALMSQSTFDGSVGVAFDTGNNRLYQSDTGSRVTIFDTAAITDGEPAVDAIGEVDENDQPMYDADGPDNAPGAQGFNAPEGAAIDEGNHRMYVADSSNNRVLVFELDSSNQPIDRTADYVLGQPDVKTVTSGTTATSMTYPRGVAVSGDGTKVFVADTFNNRVLVFDATSLSTGMAASNVLGQFDFTRSNSGSAFASMSYPEDLAYDASRELLFVADSENDQVLVFDVSDGISDGLPAIASIGMNDNWNEIDVSGLTLNATRFTVDTVNEVTYAGSQFGVLRCSLSSDCNETADFTVASGSTEYIYDVVYDSAQARLYSVNGRGEVFSCLTSSGCDEDGDWSMALDTGDLESRSLMYDATAGVLYAGTNTGVVGQIWRCDTVSDCTDSNNWSLAFSAHSSVLSLTRDTVNQVLYATDAQGFVYRCGVAEDGCESDSDWVEAIGGSTGTTISSSVFNSANHRLYFIDANGNIFWCDDSSVPCASSREEVPSLGDGGTSAQITLDASRGILYASTNGSGNVFSCDTATDCDAFSGSSWAQVYSGNPTSGLYFDVTTDALYVGQGANVVRCASSASGCNANVTIDHPSGVTYDGEHDRLFIADECNNRVLVYDVSTVDNNMGPEFVLGQSNFTDTGSSVDVSSLQLAEPACVPTTNLHMGYDAGDQILYVPDQMNNRVMVFDVNAITNGEDAVDVIGQLDFDNNAYGVSASTLNKPQATLVEQTSGRIWVVDRQSHRMVAFEQAYFPAAPPAPTPTPNGGSNPQPISPDVIGFFPDRIVVNSDASATDSRNVLVQIYAHYGATFAGTVDVLLSNTPDFNTVIPFRYMIPPTDANDTWPKTVAWDLCFGLPADQPCDPGKKIVYARFYVNLPSIWPALTPFVGPR